MQYLGNSVARFSNEPSLINTLPPILSPSTPTFLALNFPPHRIPNLSSRPPLHDFPWNANVHRAKILKGMLFILRLRYNKLGKFLAINVSGNFTWCSRYKLNWKRDYPSACVFPSNGYSVGLLYTGDKSPTIGRRVLSSGFWPLSNLSRVHTRARHALLLSILSRIENNIATRRDSRLQKVCGSRNNGEGITRRGSYVSFTGTPLSSGWLYFELHASRLSHQLFTVAIYTRGNATTLSAVISGRVKSRGK